MTKVGIFLTLIFCNLQMAAILKSKKNANTEVVNFKTICITPVLSKIKNFELFEFTSRVLFLDMLMETQKNDLCMEICFRHIAGLCRTTV